MEKEKVWMIQPVFESSFCIYKNKTAKTCIAKGNGGNECKRDLCPVKVPIGAAEYSASLNW